MRCFLPSFISYPWDAIRRPRLLFASLTDGSALGAAFTWVILLGLLTGLTGVYAGLQGKTSYGQNWWIDFPVTRAVAQSIWFCLTDVFWATLLTWGLARIGRETLRFEALFSVMAFAAAPCVFTTLAFPARDVSWLCYHGWQALNVLIVLWVSVLICVGVQTCMQTTLSRAAQCSIPAILMIGTIGWQAHSAAPTSFRAACVWEQWEGRYVRVYYPPGKSAQEVSALTRGLDAVTEQDCRVLDVKPLDFKVSVFCFDDDDLQRRLAGSSEEPDNTAHTFWDCITLSYDTWDNLHVQMAHEMCHILLANRLTDKTHGLLDEGLCEYVAHQVTSEGASPPPHSPESPSHKPASEYSSEAASEQEGPPSAPLTTIPLRTLARPEVFFDWEQVREEGPEKERRRENRAENGDEKGEEKDWRRYRSAESLVTYLKRRNGLPKLKTLYKRYAHYGEDKDPENDEGKQLAHAVADVYGLSLRQLEAEWNADTRGADKNFPEPPPPSARRPEPRFPPPGPPPFDAPDAFAPPPPGPPDFPPPR